MDLCHEFAACIVGTRYENLPAPAIDAAKKSILDTIGVTLAASGVEPAVRGLVDLVQEGGGRPECSVLGFGGRAPAVMAAFANGAMAHCLDFDDQTPWGQHASSSIIPAAFAIAERTGGVSGKHMIAAAAAGQDLFARLRCNVGWRKDWNLSTVFGVFAATAAAGHVLGLSREQMTHALGIASMQSCGVMEAVAGTGSNLRGMYAAFSAKGAVVSALLAEKGITGIEALFEGRHGIFNTYFDGKYNRGEMLKDLGNDYKGGLTLYKTWPTVGTAHSHIHATIELVTQHRLSTEDIAEIQVYVGDYHELMCSPLAARCEPATLVDAKFSLPFLVALAAVRRSVKISDFSDKVLKDPAVLAVAKKVVPVADKALDWKLDLPSGRVQIVSRDGRKFERVGANIPGSPEAPMTWDDLFQKFSDCASVAAKPLSMERIRQMQLMSRELESLGDVADLFRALA